MNIFHGDLKPIKELGFGILDFRNEIFRQVFVDNPVTGSKESQHMGNKMPFPFSQILPVIKIVAQVDFLGCPE